MQAFVHLTLAHSCTRLGNTTLVIRPPLDTFFLPSPGVSPQIHPGIWGDIFIKAETTQKCSPREAGMQEEGRGGRRLRGMNSGGRGKERNVKEKRD